MRILLLCLLMPLAFCQDPVFKDSRDLAIYLFSLEARVFNKTLTFEQLEKEVGRKTVYCTINKVDILGGDIIRTVKEDMEPEKSSVPLRIKEICSFRTDAAVFRFHIIDAGAQKELPSRAM